MEEGNMASGYEQLRQAVQCALRDGGLSLLREPKRFLGFVSDWVDPDSMEMGAVYHACNADYLAIFANAAKEGTAEAMLSAADRAATRCEYECAMRSDVALGISRAIALGTLDFLGVPTDYEARKTSEGSPWNGSGLGADEPVPGGTKGEAARVSPAEPPETSHRRVSGAASPNPPMAPVRPPAPSPSAHQITPPTPRKKHWPVVFAIIVAIAVVALVALMSLRGSMSESGQSPNQGPEESAASASDSSEESSTTGHLADLEIDLTLASDTVATIDSDLVRSWLMEGDGSEATLDLDAISDYVSHELAPELDTVGAERTYTRPDGKTIRVDGGTYGWNINCSALAEEISSCIESQSDKPIEIPCISKAAVYNPGGPDWGNRYIDVDLEEQYARMYDDSGSLIWASECVSGGPSEGNDTVTGVFAIEDKVSPMTLIGLDSNGDGEPDYENEVTYWMPFWGGYGLCDATWRYTFGGEEYLHDGSHGCVNLPYSAAEELYYAVKVGDPVIVHW